MPTDRPPLSALEPDTGKLTRFAPHLWIMALMAVSQWHDSGHAWSEELRDKMELLEDWVRDCAKEAKGGKP